MALIVKGADASIFFSKKHPARSRRNTVPALGIFMPGIALGILTGALLAGYTTLPEGVAYSSMIIFFGGLSLVIFNIVDKKYPAKEESKSSNRI